MCAQPAACEMRVNSMLKSFLVTSSQLILSNASIVHNMGFSVAVPFLSSRQVMMIWERDTVPQTHELGRRHRGIS